MKYSWLIALKKVLFAALGSVLTLLLASGGLDKFFEVLINGIPGLGLPGYIPVAVVALLKFAHNYIKQYLASKIPPVQ